MEYQRYHLLRVTLTFKEGEVLWPHRTDLVQRQKLHNSIQSMQPQVIYPHPDPRDEPYLSHRLCYKFIQTHLRQCHQFVQLTTKLDSNTPFASQEGLFVLEKSQYLEHLIKGNKCCKKMHQLTREWQENQLDSSTEKSQYLEHTHELIFSTGYY